MPMESVMPFSHRTLCRPLPLLPAVSPSSSVFSSEQHTPFTDVHPACHHAFAQKHAAAPQCQLKPEFLIWVHSSRHFFNPSQHWNFSLIRLIYSSLQYIFTLVSWLQFFHPFQILAIYQCPVQVPLSSRLLSHLFWVLTAWVESTFHNW